MYLEGLKIDCISDTHNRHKHFTMPGGDILIHSGDATLGGKLSEMTHFLKWFSEQDYSHLIFVPGNHDWLCEENPTLVAEECKNRGIILLNDSGYDAGGIKIWGSAVQPWFHDWAFNRRRGDDIAKHWALIPNDTEILVTHGPPHLIRDWVRPGTLWEEHVGCYDLMHAITTRLKSVKLHVFGHIHEGAGYTYKDGVVYVNASVLDGMYSPLAGKPIRVVKGIDDSYLVEDVSMGDEQS